MILSNIEIQRAIDERRLLIAPEPTPRRPPETVGGYCPYQTSSVDLRLASQISYFKEGLPLDINLSRGEFSRLFGPLSDTQTITGGQPFVLRPNQLVLGRTLETVTLPIMPEGQQSLAARVEGKSPTPAADCSSTSPLRRSTPVSPGRSPSNSLTSDHVTSRCTPARRSAS